MNAFYKKHKFRVYTVIILMGILSAIFLFHSHIHSLKNNATFQKVISQIQLSAKADQSAQSVNVAGGAIDENDPIEAFPRIPISGITTRFIVTFPVAQQIPAGGDIVLQLPSGFSFEDACSTIVQNHQNDDLNGPDTGVPTISSISCSDATRKVTITTKDASIQIDDRVELTVQGVINATVEGLPSTQDGFQVTIGTYDDEDTLLEVMTAYPFYLIPAGSQTISGTVFLDDGAGGGTAQDNVHNGSEAGVEDIVVCLLAFFGDFCLETDVNGDYSFGSLTDGIYDIDVPPIASGDYIGGPFFKTLELENEESATDVDFGLINSDGSITIAVNAIPSNTSLDVIAIGLGDLAGKEIVREVVWNGSANREVTMPLLDGEWTIVVKPWEEKGATGCSADAVVGYVAPQPQQVTMSGGTADDVAFVMSSQTKEIKGKVVDGNGNAIGQAFIVARPVNFSTDTGGESMAQTKRDGLFTLSVATGRYQLKAFAKGMHNPKPIEVLVRDDTGNSGTDNNANADVYRQGILILNDGDSDNDDLLFKMTKGGVSISGNVLDENGKTVAYAHVIAREIDTSGNFINEFVEAPSDVNGGYTLFVKNGKWEVEAYDPRYGRIQTRTTDVSGSNIVDFDLQASASSFGTVSGKVTQNGNAVSGVFIDIFGPNGDNYTKTGLDGTYSVKVPAGSNYIITGFSPALGELDEKTSITVTSNQTLANQNFTVGSNGTIQVTISGITDAYINAYSTTGKGAGTSQNENGVYTLSVPAGTYSVDAFSKTRGGMGRNTGVVVQSGQTTQLNLSTKSLYTVSGSISSSSSYCKDVPTVFLVDKTSDFVTVGEANSAGSYAIQVPNGTYELASGKDGCIDSASPATISVASANVSSGTNRTLNPADATIVGKAQVAGANVTSDTFIVAVDENEVHVVADVDTSISSGNNYELNVGAGTWTISAYTDGYEITDQEVTIASSESKTQNLSLSAISGYTLRSAEITSVKPSEGAVIRDTNISNNFEVQLPAGALGSSCANGSVATKYTTSIVKQTISATVVGGKAVQIIPKDSAGKPITTLKTSTGARMKIPYTDADVTALGVDETELALGTWSESAQTWIPLATTVDTVNNTLVAETKTFSLFAPVAVTGNSGSAGGGGGDGGGGGGGSGDADRIPITPPAEDPPAEDPPAEDPPAEDPPAEDPPAEDPPAEDPPAENPPAEDVPAEDPPANTPPTVDPIEDTDSGSTQEPEDAVTQKDNPQNPTQEEVKEVVPVDSYVEDPDETKPTTVLGYVVKKTEALLSSMVTSVNKLSKQPEASRIAHAIIIPSITAGAIANTVATTGLPLLAKLAQLIASQPFLLLNRKKRKGWGIVYNAITKLPIDLAYVRLIDVKTNQVLQTKVTDRDGRFSMFAEPGEYKLLIQKEEFIFPSAELFHVDKDAEYTDLYHGEIITLEKAGHISPNVPIDSKVVDTHALARLRERRLQEKMHVIFAEMGIVGALVVAMIFPSILTVGVVVTHVVLLLIIRRITIPHKPIKWGVVKDPKTKKPIKDVVVRIYDAQTHKILETKLTDSRGHYEFLTGKGAFYVTYEKNGYQRRKSDEILIEKTRSIGDSVAPDMYLAPAR